MKKIKTIIFASLVFVSILTGCNAVKSGSGEFTTSPKTAAPQNESISVFAGNMDGNDVYVDVKVNSFKIMKDKVEGLDDEAFQRTLDIYDAADSKELLAKYDFAAVELLLTSKADAEVCLGSFKLEGNADGNSFSAECFYNDSPPENGTAKQAMFTELLADTEKTVTIGFFLEKDKSSYKEFELRTTFIDTGDNKDYIEIPNQS